MEGVISFKAPWSRLLLSVSWLATAVMLGLGVALHDQMFPFAKAGFLSVLVLLIMGIPLYCIPFSITGYSITAGRELWVHRLGWKTVIPLESLRSVFFDSEATKGGGRIFGNGGLFSFSGWFTSTALGTYRAYVTDHRLTVVLVFPDRKIVVSPEQPEKFVEKVTAVRGVCGGAEAADGIAHYGRTPGSGGEI